MGLPIFLCLVKRFLSQPSPPPNNGILKANKNIEIKRESQFFKNDEVSIRLYTHKKIHNAKHIQFYVFINSHATGATFFYPNEFCECRQLPVFLARYSVWVTAYKNSCFQPTSWLSILAMFPTLKRRSLF